VGRQSRNRVKGSKMSDEEIDIIEIDEELGEAEAPPELSDGKYVGEINDVQIATSGKGNEYYAIKVVVPPENIPASIAEHYEDGAMFYYNRLLVYRGKGANRRNLVNIRKFYEAMGLDTAIKTIDPNEWMGREIGCVIRMGKDLDGNPRAEIRGFYPAEAKAKAKPRLVEKEEEAPKKRARR